MKYKHHFLILLTSFITHFNLFAQNDTLEVANRRYVKRGGIHLIGGIESPSFNRTGKNINIQPFDYSYFRAGLNFNVFDTRYYSIWLNFQYVGKGAKEYFNSTDGKINIISNTTLHYGQVELIPIVLKSGMKKINPYIFMGGYYGGLWGAESKYTINDQLKSNSQFTESLNKKDYGIILGAGIILFKVPLEFRITKGLSPIFAPKNETNNLNNQSFSIGFIL